MPTGHWKWNTYKIEVGARVPYFPSEVGIRIPCFPIASRKWELEHPVFPKSGNQSTLFLRKVGIRVPYFWGKWESEYPVWRVGEGSGNQSTLFFLGKWESGYPVWQVENLCARESATAWERNVDLDHGIGHPGSLFGKLNVQASDTWGIGGLRSLS
jgi:hypothetical protein